MKQLDLFKVEKIRKVHGGEHSVGKRKGARYFNRKNSIHLVMRSSKASGEFSFRTKENLKIVRALVEKYKKRFNVRIYELGINTNHFHFLLRAKNKKDFQDFQRVLAGQMAQKITKAIKGKPFGKFWDLLSFTQIIEWGRHFLRAREYVLQNELEASGLILYTPRKKPHSPQKKGRLASPPNRPNRFLSL